MSEEVIRTKKGLEGAIIDTTKISEVNSDTNSLLYRGYAAQELAENCGFEEVVYLLWYGELPTKSQLEEFCQKEKSYRNLDEKTLLLLNTFHEAAHPMDVLRTCVSFLGTLEHDAFDISHETNLERSFKLLAKIPTCIAYFDCIRKKKPVIPPRDDLSFTENFLNMIFGKVPNREEVKSFEVSMVTYAEHSFNASTFASRVITSTQSDIFSAIAGAIGALKGPLHGGANEAVMYMLMEIEDPKKARQWLLDALANKSKVMGFGHRVYKKGDSRVPIMKKFARKMAALREDETWMAISYELERTMAEQKEIYPNLDFPAGPAYYLMGFEIDLFTPLFVMSRISGWTAHVMEQCENNRLIRPLAEYVGPKQRPVPSISERK